MERSKSLCIHRCPARDWSQVGSDSGIWEKPSCYNVTHTYWQWKISSSCVRLASLRGATHNCYTHDQITDRSPIWDWTLNFKLVLHCHIFITCLRFIILPKFLWTKNSSGFIHLHNSSHVPQLCYTVCPPFWIPMVHISVQRAHHRPWGTTTKNEPAESTLKFTGNYFQITLARLSKILHGNQCANQWPWSFMEHSISLPQAPTPLIHLFWIIWVIICKMFNIFHLVKLKMKP